MGPPFHTTESCWDIEPESEPTGRGGRACQSKNKQQGSAQDMPTLCLCACVNVTHFLNVCACAHVGVAQSCHRSRGGGLGVTSKLNGIRVLRGLRDNMRLTDPTKWSIMSLWRNFGSKKIPNPTTVIPLDQWTLQTHMGRGRGYSRL